MKRFLQIILITALFVSVSSQTYSQYCIPPESTYGGPLTGFTNVNVGTLNNTSSNEGYTDYTGTVAPVALQIGTAYTPSFILYYDVLSSGFTDKMELRIWIDLNGDEDFEDAGEEVFSMQTVQLYSPTNNSVTGAPFTIPAGATVGTTRMRVYSDMLVADGHDVAIPCGYLNSSNSLGQHGECEDYAVNITSAVNIDDIDKNTQVMVYPNPSDGKISVIANDIVSIEIMDIQGKQIYNGIEKEIDLSQNSKGIYIIKVSTENSITVSKIILQ